MPRFAASVKTEVVIFSLIVLSAWWAQALDWHPEFFLHAAFSMSAFFFFWWLGRVFKDVLNRHPVWDNLHYFLCAFSALFAVPIGRMLGIPGL